MKNATRMQSNSVKQADCETSPKHCAWKHYDQKKKVVKNIIVQGRHLFVVDFRWCFWCFLQFNVTN